MAFSDLLNPVFSPLLNLNPLFAVGLVALLVSLIITIIYKYTTNQNLMKQLKTEMKELQKEMKELREHPEEMMKVQRRAMESNMKYMMQSFRSTLFTMLPIILIFGWMNAHFAYEPINPGESFQVVLNFAKGSTGDVMLIAPEGITINGDALQTVNEEEVYYNLKGAEGDYTQNNSLKFEYDDKIFYKDVIITDEQRYTQKDTVINHNNLKSIVINYNKKVILPILNWGWLGTYIIFSIIFSMVLRRLFGVY